MARPKISHVAIASERSIGWCWRYGWDLRVISQKQFMTGSDISMFCLGWAQQKEQKKKVEGLFVRTLILKRRFESAMLITLLIKMIR
jgi:hypothetical protein